MEFFSWKVGQGYVNFVRAPFRGKWIKMSIMCEFLPPLDFMLKKVEHNNHEFLFAVLINRVMGNINGEHIEWKMNFILGVFLGWFNMFAVNFN